MVQVYAIISLIDYMAVSILFISANLSGPRAYAPECVQ